MTEVDQKYIYTGGQVKAMNNKYPWNGSIINAGGLNDRLKYTLEITGPGGWRGTLTNANVVVVKSE
jgi:hypothetical protein